MISAEIILEVLSGQRLNSRRMEATNGLKGQVVKVKLYGGRIAERRLISDKGAIVVICSESEYQDAQKEGREPSGLGFPREDVLIETLPSSRI